MKETDLDRAVGRFNRLRFFMAVWIMLGHCSMVMESPGRVLPMIQKLDMLCVGAFFFLSAYGLYSSLEKREDYRRGFLIRKPLKLLAMAMVSVAVNEFLVWIFVPKFLPHSPGERIASFFGFINWYVWEQVFFYLIFYIAVCLIRKKEMQVLLITVLTLVMMETARRTGAGRAFYYSSLAFPAGAAVCIWREKIICFIEKRRIMTIGMLFVCWLAGMGSAFLSYDSIGGIYGRNLACVSSCLVMCVILAFLPLDAPWLGALSRLSAGIYFYHFVVINVVSMWMILRKMPRGWEFVLVVLAVTLVFSWAEFQLRTKVEGAFLCKFSKNKNSEKND